MSFVFAGTVTGVGDMVAGFARSNDELGRALDRGMQRTALGGQSIVRGKVSGRPGPRNVFGDLRRSIVGEAVREGHLFTASIGTNAPQALRLEFGFVGPDALGRNYNQPPYPYMGPAVPEVDSLARAEVAAAISGAFG